MPSSVSDRGNERLQEAIPHFTTAHRALLETLVAKGFDPDALFAPLEILREAIEETTARLELDTSSRVT